MKILFLLNGLTPYFNSVLNRINKSDGIRIVAIVPEKNSTNIGENVYLTNQGIEFKAYFLKEKKRYYGKTFLWSFSKVIENENPDIIVFIWPYILELVFNPILLLKLKRKNIKILFKEIPFQIQSFTNALHLKKFSIIDENLNSQKNSIFQRFNNLIIALIRKYYYSFIDLNLHYIEDGYEILKSYNVNKEKIFITYNSPDTDKLFEAYNKVLKEPFILPKNNHRLIHVGRLVKWKRVDLIINALSVLSKEFSDVELIVIGDGPELKYLKELAQELRLEKKINFLGPVYDTLKLGKYFQCSAIYVLGGMGGLSINEAMAFAKPIICSKCDGTEKVLIKDGYNGYVFENNDLESLIEKLNLLLSDLNKIQIFGENSLKIIREEINISTVVSGYLNAFNYVTRN